MRGRLGGVALLLAGAALPALGQQGIYSCVDAKGRHLTADRPIVECIDREQKELNPSGTVRRKLAPTLTAQERAAEEEKARLAQEEKTRAADERKRNQALITRYPDKAAHDKERAAALGASDELVVAAGKRSAALAGERQKLLTELEFYKNDPARAPARLRVLLDENQRHLDEQKRFISDQENERKRINSRFDEELARLRELWAEAKAPPPLAAASTPARPARR